MRRCKAYITLFILIAFGLKTKAQQTIQLSQYMFNGLALNPAYAGYKEDWTLNLSSRIQWVGINNAPQTGSISADGLMDSDNPNVGLGIIANYDRLGPESTSSFYANYAYRLQLDDDDTRRLCFGIGAGARQYSLDGSKFYAIDGGDASVPTGTESKLTPDFRFGIYYYTPTVYLGASAFNLLSGPVSKATNNPEIIKPQQTVYLTGGALLPLSDDIEFKPSLMIEEDFKGPTNLDLTLYIAFNNRLWIGGSYRFGVSALNRNLQDNLSSQDAAAGIVQIYISENFRIGYAYDFTTSKLASYQNGTHELSVSITFPGKRQRVVSPRYF